MIRRPWWAGAAFYQVYIRSFADGSGDGVGDLLGLQSRLPYLRDLGVEAIWVTPFFVSPMADHGYDVADPRDVDPLFGDLAAFDAMLAGAHELGLRVIVDFVPNHSSDQHPWFRAALASPDAPERDLYLFRDPAPDGGPPSPWESVFGGPAWTLDEASGQYYLHLFAPEQPDLNWRHPKVAEDAERTIRFWLDRGVDGFRIDVAHGLVKHETLGIGGQGPQRASSGGPGGLEGMGQLGAFDQPEVHSVYRSWRRLLADYEHDPVYVGEVFLWDPRKVARYLRPDELHLAFDLFLMGQPWEAKQLRYAVDLALDAYGEVGADGTWVLSNHDLPRHATRYGGGEAGRRRARAAALFQLALPGVAFVYQGDELGLEEVDVADEHKQDPLHFRSGGEKPGRDGCRIPMPWTRSGPTCGFVAGDAAGAAGADGADRAEPWLPLPDGWGDRSVEAQQHDPTSHLSLYREALRIRRTVLRAAGPLRWDDVQSGPDALSFRRPTRDGEVGVHVAFESPREVPLPDGAEVVVCSDPSVDTSARPLRLPPDTAAWVVRGAP